jgi:MtfA peptidase
MGLFDWFGHQQQAVIPDEIWGTTLATLPFLANLAVDEKNRLKLLTEKFLAEKEFSTGGNLQLTDEICVSIAAQACLPILNLGLAAYREWIGIVIYPNEFVVPRHIEDESGVVHEFTDMQSGEAWQGGPVIISWRDVQMAGTGYNVVIHEFAHQLDMLNGEADGMPALHSGISEAEWQKTFFAAYNDFCQRVDLDEKTAIDPYASDHPAEFFAVLSECFFELPDVLNREYPALYALLQRYYRQDPLTRLTKATKAASTAAS